MGKNFGKECGKSAETETVLKPQNFPGYVQVFGREGGINAQKRDRRKSRGRRRDRAVPLFGQGRRAV